MRKASVSCFYLELKNPLQTQDCGEIRVTQKKIGEKEKTDTGFDRKSVSEICPE